MGRSAPLLGSFAVAGYGSSGESGGVLDVAARGAVADAGDEPDERCGTVIRVLYSHEKTHKMR